MQGNFHCDFSFKDKVDFAGALLGTQPNGRGFASTLIRTGDTRSCG
jgi:hypothetical protein